MSAFARDSSYVGRFRVEDLVPPRAAGVIRAIFVGESPHRDEVAPESPNERTPFRGMAGRELWKALGARTARPPEVKPMPSRARLLELCSELGVSVLNAVQYPLDPKITIHYGAGSDPVAGLGFCKAAGPSGYKAVQKKGTPEARLRLRAAVENLADRLAQQLDGRKAELAPPIVCLGNDARWFVDQAVEALGWRTGSPRVLTMPHPACWWRNRKNRERAEAVLTEVIGPSLSFDRVSEPTLPFGSA